ncbi:hypothetical protein IFM89_031275 [Coptis chinensis]|uniref:Pentatricopeptide repeat-containing protein n=1 Tax=Coptis chinensis TaxID=261450 RepID=A0A835IZ67_9MAGN|nr:hypothetical protein IFM89_031275 [Coptis chinensis]
MRPNLLPHHVAAVVKCQKDPLRALEMFNSAAKEDGFKHTVYTYKCMVEKLGLHGKFEAMEGVMSEMRRNVDNGLMEGVYIGAMRNYGRNGKVQAAVDVFERMDFFSCEPSVLSYNAIMNILVESKYFVQAHKVYLRMVAKGISPDVYTFTIRIKSFCRTSRPHVALRLLRNMPSQGCMLNAVAYCTVIGGFYEEDHQIPASDLFNEMLGEGICPDITTFNKLIHTLCKKGHVRESDKLLNKILKRGVSPNLFTFNIFIQGLCKENKNKEAFRLLDCMTRGGLSPDVVTYNTLISGLCRISKVVEAESYLHKMVNRGYQPDDFTYNTIIDGYCRVGSVQNACEILKDAVFKGFVPDQITYVSLINGLCQEGDIDRAMEVFNEATVNGTKPNIVVYNSVIKGLCQQGLILQALNLLDEMFENGCSPNMWTYNIVINGLYAVSFGTVIHGFCESGDVEGAYKLFMKMEQQVHILHTAATYNIMINAFSEKLNVHMAEKLFHEMGHKGCIPDGFTYRALIDGFSQKGNIDTGYKFLVEMIDKGYTPSLTTFGRILNCFCANHRVSDAVGIIHLMVAKGIVPEIVNTIFESDKKNVAAPKIIVEDLLKKGLIVDPLSPIGGITIRVAVWFGLHGSYWFREVRGLMGHYEVHGLRVCKEREADRCNIRVKVVNRLTSVTGLTPPKKHIGKSFPANVRLILDCKLHGTESSHSWASPFPEMAASDIALH